MQNLIIMDRFYKIILAEDLNQFKGTNRRSEFRTSSQAHTQFTFKVYGSQALDRSVEKLGGEARFLPLHQPCGG